GIEEIVPLLVFGGIVAAIFAMLTMISNRNSRAAERLDQLSRPQSLVEIEDPKNKKERFAGILETAKALYRPLMPQTELEQSKLKIRLANAGFRSDSAVSVYLGLSFGTFMLFLLASLAIFLPKYGFTVTALKPIVLIGGIGFYLPKIILWYLRSKRMEAIF